MEAEKQPEISESETITLLCGHTYWISADRIQEVLEQKVNPVCAFEECSPYFEESSDGTDMQ